MFLEIKQIKKSFGMGDSRIEVLKGIDLEIERGEFCVLLGPSGSGKTTLMNIIGCLDRPTKGEFLLEGESIVNYNENRLSDLRLNTLGFVFQSFNLLPKQTALDNVALPLSYAGVPVKKRKEIAFQALKRVGLAERVHFRPSQLSGGQQQRVAIARALVNNPKIILADEPTGALDSRSGIQVMNLFQQLNEEGVTIIMITHDANIANHAKKVLHIFDGEIVEDKERKEKQQAEVQSEKEAKNDTVFSEIEQDFGVKEWEGEI
jgi:putative ABC transport system ATP-binding protein